MFSIGTLPKPFLGHIGIIQRNAIESWLQLTPRPEVVLFGSEEGVADIARELRISHMPDVACNSYGTPYLPAVFEAFERTVTADVLCFSNCDIILMHELPLAIERARAAFKEFVLVGECMNLDVRQPIAFADTSWETRLREDVLRHGKRRGINADYFVFTRGAFPNPPPLILGRPYYDNWIMWEARRRGIPLIDATGQVTAIHQNHYYSAVPGETADSHKGFEAEENLRILGTTHVYWITDRSHVLTRSGVRRTWAGTLQLRRRWEGIVKDLRYGVVDMLRFLHIHD